MEKKPIFGHRSARQQLADQFKNGQLAHAYLFYGPQGVGKRLVAGEFASEILNGSVVDLMELDLGNEDNNSVQSVREFLSIVSSKPLMGDKKVALVNNFDLANAAIENAMLKTLEEPTPSTVLILISSRQPVPTVLSRSRVISFNRLSFDDLRAFAKDRGLQVTEEMFALAAGSPAKLIELANKSKGLVQAVSWSKRLAEVATATTADKLLAISELGGEDTETLREVLLLLLEQQRSQLETEPSLSLAMRKTVDALGLLRSNLNKKLVLQRLLL